MPTIASPPASSLAADMTRSDADLLRNAAEVCRLWELTPSAKTLLQPTWSVRQFYEQLVALDHLADARRLLAHALPARRAIWWASLCLHHSWLHKPFATPEEDQAFAAVLDWFRQPGEATRRAAEQAGWSAQPSTAAAILAISVFLSGGSISRPGLPPVYPKSHLSGRLAGVVIYLASVRFDPARYKQYLRQYLSIGEQVAWGDNFPPEVPPCAEAIAQPMLSPVAKPLSASAPTLDPRLALLLQHFLQADTMSLSQFFRMPSPAAGETP